MKRFRSSLVVKCASSRKLRERQVSSGIGSKDREQSSSESQEDSPDRKFFFSMGSDFFKLELYVLFLCRSVIVHPSNPPPLTWAFCDIPPMPTPRSSEYLKKNAVVTYSDYQCRGRLWEFLVLFQVRHPHGRPILVHREVIYLESMGSWA